jgi:hypothetical protein
MNTCTISLEETLEQAKAAALAKSQEIWDRDEHQDRGSCGGAVMMLDARTKLAKLAIEKGLAWGSGKDVYVNVILAEGVRSQNADIYQDSARAFRKVLIDAGFEKAIKKFWTYID